MALEDVIKAYERYGTIINVAQATEKDPSSPESLDSFANYVRKYEGGSEEDAEFMSTEDTELQTNHVKRRRLINSRIALSQNSLLEKTASEYKNIVVGMATDQLVALALGLPDKNKKYLGIQVALSQDKLEDARRIYMSISDSEFFKNYVGDMSEETLKKYLERAYLPAQQRKFREKYLSKKVKDVKGKEKYEIDVEKTRKYVLDNIEGLKEDSNERKEVYLNLAQIYVASKQKKKK